MCLQHTCNDTVRGSKPQKQYSVIRFGEFRPLCVEKSRRISTVHSCDHGWRIVLKVTPAGGRCLASGGSSINIVNAGLQKLPRPWPGWPGHILHPWWSVKGIAGLNKTKVILSGSMTNTRGQFMEMDREQRRGFMYVISGPDVDITPICFRFSSHISFTWIVPINFSSKTRVMNAQ